MKSFEEKNFPIPSWTRYMEAVIDETTKEIVELHFYARNPNILIEGGNHSVETEGYKATIKYE